jgi:hypothetical protein
MSHPVRPLLREFAPDFANELAVLLRAADEQLSGFGWNLSELGRSLLDTADRTSGFFVAPTLSSEVTRWIPD